MAKTRTREPKAEIPSNVILSNVIGFPVFPHAWFPIIRGVRSIRELRYIAYALAGEVRERANDAETKCYFFTTEDLKLP